MLNSLLVFQLSQQHNYMSRSIDMAVEVEESLCNVVNIVSSLYI